MTKKDYQKIIFFDGVCNLCNQAIDFFVRQDHGNQFYYASLQSDFAKKFLLYHGRNPEDLKTVVFYDAGRILDKSRAIGNAMLDLGWPWNWCGSLILLTPKFIADSVYNFIATHRYRWYGKAETCRLPTEQEKSYFLS